MDEEELQAEEGTLLGNYYSRISSETGLPKKQVEQVDPNTMLGAAYARTKDPKYLIGGGNGTPNPDYNPLRTSAGTMDLTNAYPEPLANYRDYDVPLSPFADLNDERAKRQWTVEKWAHGLTKAGITFGTAFAENTVGLIAGLGNLAFGENHSFTDNPFGRAMDQINEAAREALPNYYTKAEQEASIIGDGWGSGLLSANFWADKVAGGAAYTVASIASMFVGTGEAALVAKLAGAGKYGKLTGVLNKLDKVDELADGIGVGVRSNKSAAYQAAKLISTGGDATDVVAQTGKLSRVANMKVGARNFTIATQMSLAEASMESRESTNRFKEEKIAEWEQATGLDRNQMDIDTLNAIEASAAAAGNLTFGINLPILMASNAIMFGKMFKSGKPLAEAVSSKVTRDAAGTWIEQTAKTGFGKAYAKADRLFGKTASGIVTEGFQEGTQFLASEMSRRYYSDKYQTGVGDMVAAFNYGLAETLGSKEGIENIFIGALIGGGTGTISRMFGADKKFQAEKDSNTQKLLTLLNNGGLTKALENLDSTEQLLYTNTLAEAASKGNYMVAERVRDRLILSVTNQFRKLGGLDAAFEQLDDMKSFTEQEFKERWGYDMSKSLKEQTGKTQLELIEEVKTKMENYTKVSENIESIIAERQIPQQVIPRVIDNLFQTPEIKNAKILQDKVFSTYANMLLNRIIDIDSIDTGISDRYEKLVQLIPGLGAFSKEDFEFGIKVGEFTFKDGKVELSREITQEPEDSTVQNEKGVYEQSKRIKKLQEIRDVINAFNDIGRADLAAEASKIFDELTVLMADRTVVNTALKRMNASPNEIAAMLEEELLQQYYDSISGEIANANTVLERAESSTDIETGVPNIQNLPANIKNELKKKWLELWNEETKLVSNYLSLSEDDFNAIDVDKLSPKEKAAYDRAKSRKDVSAEVLKAKQAEEARQAAEAASIPTSEENPGTVNGNTVSYDTVLTDAEMQAFADITFIGANNWLSTSAIKVGENQFTWRSPGIYMKIDGKEYANLEEDSLDALTFDFATGEAVAITLTDLETGNKVTWSIQEGENLTAAQIKDTARARSLIYFTYAKAASVIPITSKEQADQVEENLKTEQQVLTEEFTELTGEKVTPSKEELNQYALDNIERTKNLSDGQLRVQIEELKNMIGDISSQIEGFIKLGESQFGDRKSAEQYYAGDLRELRALNKRLKNYLSNKINVLKGRKSTQKAAVVGGENVNPEKTETGQLTDDDVNYLIENAQNEINDLNEQLTKLNKRIENYELIEGSLKSLNSLNKLKKDVQVVEAKIKKRENLISNLNETRESQKRPEDSNIAEGPSQPTEGERPEAADLPTAEASQGEGISITEVSPLQIETILAEANEAIKPVTIPPTQPEPGPIVEPLSAERQETVSSEFLDISLSKSIDRKATDENGNLVFKDRNAQKIDGQPIEPAVDFNALGSNDVTPANPDMVVRFEVREDTDYWKNQRAAQNFTTEEQYNAWMMTEGWKNVPIYVMTEDGKRLPLLTAYNEDEGKGMSRQLIYKLFKSGRTPIAKAEKVFSTEDIRFKRNQDGSIAFYDLRSLFSGSKDEVLQQIRDNIVFVGMSDGQLVWKVNSVDVVRPINQDEAIMGQMGIMLKSPNGGMTIVTLATRDIKDVQSALGAAMKSLKTEGLGLANFSKIVGTNKIEFLTGSNIEEAPVKDNELQREIEEIDQNNGKDKFILVESLGSTGISLFTYFSKSLNKFVRLNEEQLRLALNGNLTFRFQTIEFQITEEGVRAIPSLDSQKASNRELLINNIDKEIRDVVNQKKFQVSINTIKDDRYGFSISLDGQDQLDFNSYIEYLISDNTLGTPRINGTGTGAILATNIEVADNNNIYFDTGLKFKQIGTQEDGQLPLKESIGSMLPGKRGDATPVTTTPTPKTPIKSVTIGDVTLTQEIKDNGAIGNTITNDKTGEGIFQLITPEGKVIYAPIIGKNFVESVSKYSGKNISEQADIIFSGVRINDLLAALGTTPVTNTPAAPVSDIEAEKQKITPTEFKEVVRLAKFFLENPSEPGVIGDARSRYPELFKAVTDIERKRREELKEWREKYSEFFENAGKQSTNPEQNKKDIAGLEADYQRYVDNTNDIYDEELKALTKTTPTTPASDKKDDIERRIVELQKRLDEDKYEKEKQDVLNSLTKGFLPEGFRFVDSPASIQKYNSEKNKWEDANKEILSKDKETLKSLDIYFNQKGFGEKLSSINKQYRELIKPFEEKERQEDDSIIDEQVKLLSTKEGILIRKDWSLGKGLGYSGEGTDGILEIDEDENGNKFEAEYYLTGKDNEWVEYSYFLGKTKQEVIDKINAKYNEELAALGQPSAPVVTQPAATTPKVIDIVEQPAENSNADALKDTEDIMDEIYGEIEGVATLAELVKTQTKEDTGLPDFLASRVKTDQQIVEEINSVKGTSMTVEDWNNLSRAEQNNLINCL